MARTQPRAAESLDLSLVRGGRWGEHPCERTARVGVETLAEGCL